MNRNACFKRINQYLAKDNVQPYIVDVQTAEDLSSVITEYNVGENRIISLSEYCNKDEFPHIDNLFDELSKKTGVTFVTGLSTFLKLEGEQVLKDTLKDILYLNTRGHVIVITYQCKKILDDFTDPRLSNQICILDAEESQRPSLVFIGDNIPLSDNITPIIGLANIATQYEKANGGTIYIKTKKNKATFPTSLIAITDLSDPYSALCMADSATLSLSKTLGSDEQWSYILEKFDKNSSWTKIVDMEFGNHHTLGSILSNYLFFDKNKKWFYLIALKLYGEKNNWVLTTAAKKTTSEKDFFKQIYRSMLDMKPTDEKFQDYYAQRKMVLSQIDNPIEEVVDFCKIVTMKGSDAIFYLTDNTQKEKEMIIALLDKYGASYDKDVLENILKTVYPDLCAYLRDYSFNNLLLDSYFSQYKYQKVINKLFSKFLDVVLEQAEKREYSLILSPRTSIVEKIDRNNAQLYFMDAMGVEFLGYIMSVCSELELMATIKVCSCELPSITSKNKEFLDLFANSTHPTISVKELDELKHHGQGDYDYRNTKLPLYIIKELEIIRDVLTKIKEKLINGTINKVIMISDHGASRLAVINESENVWEMSEKSEHSGRCCRKNEVDTQPLYAIDAGDFWALANYDRFKGGRKANVEVHGGATLEEVTVPIIEITKMANDIEITIIDTVITVSYKRKASIKLFSKTKIENISIKVDGQSFDAQEIDDNIYQVNMPQIKKAGTYSVDVYSSENRIAEGLSFTVKKEGSQENELL